MFTKKKSNSNPAQKTSVLMLAIFAGIVVLLDQVSKYIVLTKLPLYSSINVIPNFLNIIHIHNPGGAFGFMSQSNTTIRGLLFIGVSCILITIIIYFYRTIYYAQKFFAFGLSLIVGGAIGNVIDRLRLGEVIDFIDFFLLSYHWPTFNIADTSIMIGISILFLYVILGKNPT